MILLFFNAVRPIVLPRAPPSGLFRSNKPGSGFSWACFRVDYRFFVDSCRNKRRLQNL